MAAAYENGFVQAAAILFFVVAGWLEVMMSLLYKKNRKFYLMLIVPALLIYSFALLVPLFGGTIPYSFLKWNLMSGKKSFVGLDNYIKLFSDTKFWTSLLFNLKVGLFTIIGSNILGFVLAYFLNENIRAKGLIRAMFFIPNIVSAVLVSFIWVFIFTCAMPALGNTFGWEWLTNISWFGTPEMATVTVIVVSIWQSVGFLMIVYTAGLQTIPKDVMESAQLDGCSGLKKVLKIQIPLLMPTVTINLFVSISSAFKLYDISNAMTGGGPYGSTMPVAMNIYQEAFKKYNLGYGSAKSVVLCLIVAVVTLIQLYFTRKREVEF